MPRRALSLALLALLAAACSTPSPTAEGPRRGPGADVPSPPRGSLRAKPMARIACSLPEPWIRAIANGYMPGRSANLQVVPRPPHFIGSAVLHAGPWDYLQRVPLFWYGPGHVRPVGSLSDEATIADIAPTTARLIDFDFEAPDGRELDVVEPVRGAPPRLVVTLIWDSAGMNVLQEWPQAWPLLRRLSEQGAWYEDARLASSPSQTAPTHATIGTGAFPRRHGLVSHGFMVDGEPAYPWRGENSPDLLLEPTLADLYDAATGNRPLIGISATVAINLGLVGHGTAWPGGDADVAIIREPPGAETLGAEGDRWNLLDHLAPYFELPPYVNDLPPLSDYFDETDRIDGTVDGAWRGHPLDDALEGFDTPARIPYQTRLVEELIRREGFGSDDVPDLLFVNYKLIDKIGHTTTMNSPEMRDALRMQDRYLGELIEFLDEEVGEGRWALVMTADHGSTPDPEVSGAFRISGGKLFAALQEAFDLDDDDVPVIEEAGRTEIRVNEEELAEHGSDLADVARFVMGLTREQTFIPDVSEPGDRPQERVFRAAFPSEVLDSLPCLAD